MCEKDLNMNVSSIFLAQKMKAHCINPPPPPPHPTPHIQAHILLCGLQSWFCNGDLHSQEGFLSCLLELLSQGEPFVGG